MTVTDGCMVSEIHSYLQDIRVIVEMLKGPRAAKAGIIYLQDEKCEFRTKENGRLWSVYGSPVCSTILNYVIALNLPLVVSKILQLGIQL